MAPSAIIKIQNQCLNQTGKCVALCCGHSCGVARLF